MGKKTKLFSEENAAILAEWLTDTEIVELPKPDQAQAEAIALKKLLDEYSAAISKGYHLVMSEVSSNPEKRSRINDFRIDTNIIKQMRNPADASRLLQEHGVLQGVLGISGETMGDMYRIARDLYEGNKYDQASWVLQYMLFLNPYVCWLWQELGHCCLALNQWDEAVWAFGVAINCDPREQELYRSAVNAIMELKDYAKAKEFIQFGLDRVEKGMPNPKWDKIKEFLVDLMEQVKRKENGGG